MLHFEKIKHTLLEDLIVEEAPSAIILGGQPACGKSKLGVGLEKNWLVINGDDYRAFHPQASYLSRDNFSQETQIYSNVFTEQLIKVACKSKFNMSIEGTMRDPRVPLRTASFLKDHGYNVELAVIAAHPLITELGIYRRYDEERTSNGKGRLADIDSHNLACSGLLQSIDTLYDQKAVRTIRIHNYLGKSCIKRMSLVADQWDCLQKPSSFIEQERHGQLRDMELIDRHIKLGKQTLDRIEEPLKPKVLKLINHLKKIKNSQQ